ncbi:MAG: YkgJ family cysteine cluster protein [Anaerobutyricum hallii]
MRELYKELDRGDGTCKYLQGNLCTIYTERPLLCRIDECYEKFFKDQMTLEQYYKVIMKCAKKSDDGRNRLCYYHLY